jgi:hypothetical protein
MKIAPVEDANAAPTRLEPPDSRFPEKAGFIGGAPEDRVVHTYRACLRLVSSSIIMIAPTYRGRNFFSTIAL